MRDDGIERAVGDRDGAPLVGDVRRDLRASVSASWRAMGRRRSRSCARSTTTPGSCRSSPRRVSDAMAQLTPAEGARSDGDLLGAQPAGPNARGRIATVPALPGMRRLVPVPRRARRARRTWFGRARSGSPPRPRGRARGATAGPVVGSADRGRDRPSRVGRAARRWSCARPASSPTISRSCTTWTSRRGRSPSGRGCGSCAPRCRTPIPRSCACSRTSSARIWRFRRLRAVGDRVVVVGGGISGLATAYRLLRDGPSLDVTVLEADPAVGGRLVHRGGRRPRARGRARLVRRAQALGRRPVPGARRSS